jgi:hypothetical protein
MQKSDPKAKTFKLIDSFEIDKALGGNKKGIPVTFDFRREAGIRAA